MKPFSFPSFNLPSFLVGCVVIALSCFIFYSFGDRKPKLLTDIDYRFMDLMFHFRGPQPDSGQVVIIDIDEKSLTGAMAMAPQPDGRSHCNADQPSR